MAAGARALAGYWQGVLKVFFVVLLIVGANLAAEEVVNLLQLDIRPANEELVHRIIMVAALAYTVLLAMPFVPGVEIGLAMIGMLGPPIVFLMYLCTLVGLSMSFAVGRLIPLATLAAAFSSLRIYKASRLLTTLAPMGQDRFAFLVANSSNRRLPFLLRHRYIALAMVVNLPGNILIGGGGGIALMAGASKLYSLPGFVLTIVLAVSPVPLAVLIFGRSVLAG